MESQSRKPRPDLPCKTRIVLFFMGAIIDLSSRSDGTVNRTFFTLLEYIGFKSPPDPKPRNGTTTSDVTVDPSRNLGFRIFAPVPSQSQSHARLPVVVFFHGGGFAYLAPDYKIYDDVCRRLAREIPAVIVSVNYRLAPEHPYPAAYEDGFDVLQFLNDRTHVLPENADISWCFVAGDSSGGNLAHFITKRACESSLARLKVIGVMSIQAFFGGEKPTKSEIQLEGVDPVVTMKRTEWMWNAFIPPGSGMDRDDEVINVSGPHAADISKLDFPPTMVVVAGFDSLKDRQMGHYEYLKSSGKEAHLVEFPDMVHGFYIFPELPQSTQLFSEASKFVHKQVQMQTESSISE